MSSEAYCNRCISENASSDTENPDTSQFQGMCHGCIKYYCDRCISENASSDTENPDTDAYRDICPGCVKYYCDTCRTQKAWKYIKEPIHNLHRACCPGCTEKTRIFMIPYLKYLPFPGEEGFQGNLPHKDSFSTPPPSNENEEFACREGKRRKK